MQNSNGILVLRGTERRTPVKGIQHSEEQTIAIIKQGETGLVTADLCRLLPLEGEYGSMESGEAKRLSTGRKEPEAEAR